MLKVILAELRDGNKLTLSQIKNQKGEMIDEKTLSFSSGKWRVLRINCYSSEELGLGICTCISHSPKFSLPVSRKEALAEVRLVVSKQLADEKQARKEIAWLDRAINELS